MSLCISGSEIEVLADMLAHGGLFAIDAMMVEWHERLAKDQSRKDESIKLKKKLQVIQNSTQLFHLLNVDDEKHMLSNFPLPNCH